MVKIRLARHGKRNQPFYKIVAISDHQKREGKPLEEIGFYNPAKNITKIDKEKLDAWVKKGALITTAVSKLIEKI